MADGGLVIVCFFVPGRQLLAIGGTDKRLTLHSLEDPAAKTVIVERPAILSAHTASHDGSPSLSAI